MPLEAPAKSELLIPTVNYNMADTQTCNLDTLLRPLISRVKYFYVLNRLTIQMLGNLKIPNWMITNIPLSLPL
jgi:hypothetical protein